MKAIPLATCYVYAPQADRERARRLRVCVKSGDVRELLERALRSAGGESATSPLMRFFPPTAALVPVPGSEPRRATQSTAAGWLATALLGQRLGTSVWFGLSRVRVVRKSGTAAPGGRPTVREQYETMAVAASGLPDCDSIVLVDDIVSKGRTLLASALRIRDVMPAADVRAFALLRTVACGTPAERALLPCVGRIELRREDARRIP